MTPENIRSTFLGALLILIPLTAAAENGKERSPIIWGLDGGVIHQFSTDLSDADGAFTVNRHFIQPSVSYAWNRRKAVSLSLGYGESDYDFAPGATIEGLEPWGRVRDYHISLAIRFSPTERTDVFVRPIVRSFAEKGASVNDGRTEGLIAGMSWVVSETLTIGPGLGWFTRLGGGSQAFPILIINWDITERLSLTTGRGVAASMGPGLTLNYQLSDKWALSLLGRSENIRFALEGSSPAYAEYGKDQSLPLIFGISHKPWRGTSVSALIGIELDGRLSLRDDTGDNIALEKYDTPLMIGLAFRSRF